MYSSLSLSLIPVWVRLLSVLALSSTLSSCAIHSNLNIPAGQEFVLGGNGNGRFKVELNNTGQPEVEVLEDFASGKVVTIGKLAPNAKSKRRFSSGSAAILRNPTDQDALVKVRITGDLRLGMVYEDAGQELR
ncbi:MAG: hypothetical protein AAF399_13305 [Bacteroidota bacterium]